MKGIILAAGLGTRLRPLTHEIPKALIPVAGRPLIHYPIALLKKSGVTDIAINLHHLGERIKGDLGDGQGLGVSITYSEESEILGTGGGIMKLAFFFGMESFVVINSDILIDVNLEDVIAQHLKHHALATMVLRPHPRISKEAGNPTALFTDELGVIDKSTPGDQIPTTESRPPKMFTGVHVIHPRLLTSLPKGFSCIFQDAYAPAIADGDPIFGYDYDGYWRDLGTMEAYDQADKELSSGQVKLSYIP